MLHALTDPWSQGFVQRAFFELALLGVVGGALGCWVLFYELSYGAESLAHALFPGLVLAALAGVLVLVVLAGGLSRPLRRITDAVGRVGSGDLDADVPEQGTEELVLLAQTVNTMRREVAARAATAQEERTARDAILSAKTCASSPTPNSVAEVRLR